MMYWYEVVLIYFASGLIVAWMHKLYPILPPKTPLGYVIISIVFASLVLSWWFILKPYETIEFPLSIAQKNQFLYALIINVPIGHMFFSYLLGWDK